MAKKFKKVDQVLEQSLLGEDVDELLKSLTPTEKKLFYDVVKELRTCGESDILEQLWRIDYRRAPPTIREFVEDPFWLGEVLKSSDENPGLFPTWKEILVRDFDKESVINNLVITGSLGIGKTYVALVIFLYRLTMAALLRNPTNFFGLSKGSRIMYCILSVSRSVVSQTAFGDAINFLGNSPFFVEDLHFNANLKYSNQEIRLGEGGIVLTAGSKGHHVIGRNTLGIFLDEGNFRLEKNPDMRAYKLFGEIRTRIKNRFQKVAGFLPAISIISSSATDESSFTSMIIEDIVKSKDKTQLVYSNNIYQIKSADEWRRLETPEELIDMHALKLKPTWFKVAHGLKNVDPVMLKGLYDKNGKPVGKGPWEEPTPGCKVELVPVDYIEDFQRNVIVSLQSISGISTGSSMRMFPSMADVHKCIEQSKSLNLPKVCQTAFIPCSQEDDKEIWDYLIHNEFLQRVKGMICPKRHPGAPRFLHLDLATRTTAGLAICHPVAAKEVNGVVRIDGTVFDEWRMIVEFDMILAITSGKSKPISFEKIQKFIMWLRDRAGFQFGLVTADTFQSHMQLEMLETRGFKIDALSVDRTKKPYYALRTAFEDGRVYLDHAPELLLKEFENLIDLPDKIDHPEHGSKDLADAVAGSYYDAVTSGLSMMEPEPTLHQSKDTQDGGPVWTESGAPSINLGVEPTHRRTTRVFTS